jgi:hypothetical protein
LAQGAKEVAARIPTVVSDDIFGADSPTTILGNAMLRIELK